MESLLRDVILDHVTENSLLSDDQHGFSKGKSCMSNLLITLEDVTESVDEGYGVDIMYFDYSKAFDTSFWSPNLRPSESLAIFWSGSRTSWLEGSNKWVLGKIYQTGQMCWVASLKDQFSVSSSVSCMSTIFQTLFRRRPNCLQMTPSCTTESKRVAQKEVKPYRMTWRILKGGQTPGSFASMRGSVRACT